MHRRAFLGACTVAGAAFAQRVQLDTAVEAKGALLSSWASFSEQFCRPDGRVVDNGNKGITHSEGLGVAMLAAQACDDRKSFNRIHAFSKKLRRPDGLHSWKWEPGAGITDRNNASDGDLYIAWALTRAAARWGDAALVDDAAEIGRALRRTCVVRSSQGQVLVPGAEGFVNRSFFGAERTVVNASYWAWPAFKEIQAADPSPLWATLQKNGLSILESAQFGTLQLPPDWLLLSDPMQPWKDRPAQFGYEAIRIPLFLAWARRPTHTALRSCAAHMQRPGFPAWVSLDSSERANYQAPPGFEAVARLARKSVFGEPFALPPIANSDYYSSSLILLSALAATDLGWM